MFPLKKYKLPYSKKLARRIYRKTTPYINMLCNVSYMGQSWYNRLLEFKWDLQAFEHRFTRIISPVLNGIRVDVRKKVRKHAI